MSTIGQEPLAAGRMLRRRLDLCIAIFAVLMSTAYLLEIALHPDRTGAVVVVVAAELAIILAALVLVRLPGMIPWTRWIGTVAMALLGLCLALHHSWVGAPLQRLALAEVCLMTGVAIVFAPGWRGQLVVSAAALGGFLAVAVERALSSALLETETTGERALFGLLGALSGAAASIGAVWLLERYAEEAGEEAAINAALLHAARSLAAHPAEADVLSVVNELSVSALGIDWSGTFLRAEGTPVFRHCASAGLRDEVRTELAALDLTPDNMPFLGRLQPGALIEIRVGGDRHDVPLGLLERVEARAVLVAPITRGDTVIGTLTFGYRHDHGPFTRRQRALAMGISQLVAVALENARLIAALRSASQLKSEFVATMSHELRTPLNVIAGYVDLIADGDFGPVTSEQAEVLDRVRSNTRELRLMIDQTLDLGRLEAGRVTVDLEPVDLSALWRELDQETRGLARPGVELTWICRPPGARITSDALKLRLIVKNLIGNALKFTAAGRVAVAAEALPDRLTVEVRDSGVGIAEDDLPVIFEMFRQGTAAIGTLHEGVGLGLYIVQRLVGLLGGTVSVESRLGHGSTFRVEIPAQRIASAIETSPSPKGPGYPVSSRPAGVA